MAFLFLFNFFTVSTKYCKVYIYVNAQVVIISQYIEREDIVLFTVLLFQLLVVRGRREDSRSFCLTGRCDL